jgi:hypothetical protein
LANTTIRGFEMPLSHRTLWIAGAIALAVVAVVLIAVFAGNGGGGGVGY